MRKGYEVPVTAEGNIFARLLAKEYYIPFITAKSKNFIVPATSKQILNYAQDNIQNLTISQVDGIEVLQNIKRGKNPGTEIIACGVNAFRQTLVNLQTQNFDSMHSIGAAVKKELLRLKNIKIVVLPPIQVQETQLDRIEKAISEHQRSTDLLLGTLHRKGIL